MLPECRAHLLQPPPALRRPWRRSSPAVRVAGKHDAKVHVLRETADQAVISRRAGRTDHDERSAGIRERFQRFEGLGHAQVLLRTAQRVAVVEALEMSLGFSLGGKRIGRGRRNLPRAPTPPVRCLELHPHPVSGNPAPATTIDPDHGPIGPGRPAFQGPGRDDAVAQRRERPGRGLKHLGAADPMDAGPVTTDPPLVAKPAKSPVASPVRDPRRLDLGARQGQPARLFEQPPRWPPGRER